MDGLEKLARELMEVKDNSFKRKGDLAWQDLARYVQRLLLEARKKGIEYGQENIYDDKELQDIESQLKKLEG